MTLDKSLNPFKPQFAHVEGDRNYYNIRLWWGWNKTTYIKYSSQILARYTCTEQNWFLLLCPAMLPSLFNRQLAFLLWREHPVPHAEWCQLDSRPSRVSPHPAKTVSPSSSCPASTIKRAQLPASPWHSLVEPSLVLSLLTLPPPLQGSESFDVHVAAWQGQEDKTLLVPSLYNKTFGNLEGHRDKRMGFFSFFLFFFFPTTNGGLSLPAAPSEPHQHQRAWNLQKAKAGEI